MIPRTRNAVMKTVSNLRDDVESWNSLKQHLHDLTELASLKMNLCAASWRLRSPNSKPTLKNVLLPRCSPAFTIMTDAILAISTPVQAERIRRNWAGMLQRMYLRWAEDQGFRVEILDFTPGEEAGIKSMTITVGCRYCLWLFAI